MSKRSSIWLCLALLTACSTARPSVVVKTEYVKPKVPAVLTAPCENKQRGSLPTIEAIVSRLQYTEGALDRCAAKVNGIRKWSGK